MCLDELESELPENHHALRRFSITVLHLTFHLYTLWIRFKARQLFMCLVCPGVSPGQCSSEGLVRAIGHFPWASRENLDMFWALSGPLYGSDEGQTPRPAAAVQRLHHIKGEKRKENWLLQRGVSGSVSRFPWWNWTGFVTCNHKSTGTFTHSGNVLCVLFAFFVDHQRDSRLPGHHEVLSQSTTGQQPRMSTHSNAAECHDTG